MTHRVVVTKVGKGFGGTSSRISAELLLVCSGDEGEVSVDYVLQTTL